MRTLITRLRLVIILVLLTLAAPATATEVAEVNGHVLFERSSRAAGNELWVSDGTAAGTRLLRDIYPGPEGSDPEMLCTLNDRLLFFANDGNGHRLWHTDGTFDGTELLVDVEGSVGTNPGGPIVTAPLPPKLNQTLLDGFAMFIGTDGDGRELWRTDGTPGGTYQVLDIRNGAEDSGINSMIAAGNLVIFNADATGSDERMWASNGTPGETEAIETFPMVSRIVVDGELWFTRGGLYRTDGTGGGATEVGDVPIGVGLFGTVRSEMANAGGIIYLTADGPDSNDTELWRSDGTGGGTYLLKNINDGTSADPGSLIPFGSRLYFTAEESDGYRYLYTSDGTTDGTVRVTGIGRQSNGSSALTAVEYEAQLYTTLIDDPITPDLQIWTLSGGAATPAIDTAPGAASGAASSWFVLGGFLYFIATGEADASGHQERGLWRTDGTQPGTVFVGPLETVERQIDVETLGATGDIMWLSVEETFVQQGLWASDGTPAGTHMLRDIRRGADDDDHSTIGHPTLLADGRTVLVANSGSVGRSLWVTDGTAAGTCPLVLETSENGVQLGGDAPVALGDFAYFVAYDPVFDGQLWRTDGTPEGTERVTALAGGVTGIARFGTSLLLRASNGSDGFELWISDGTAGTTSMVLDINDGDSSDPQFIGEMAGEMYFRANDGGGEALWKTNGVDTGTSLVSSAVSPSTGDPEWCVVGGLAFFEGYTLAEGQELWVTDGSPGGTELVRDIRDGPSGSQLSNVTAFGGQVVLEATSDDEGREVWISDGSLDGTELLLGDFSPGSDAEFATELVDVLDGQVILSGWQEATGWELYRSDGTIGGTAVVRDIVPGPDGSRPTAWKGRLGDLLLFLADDGEGRRLWATDGTEGGTIPLIDEPRSGNGAKVEEAVVAADGRVFHSRWPPFLVGGRLSISNGETTTVEYELFPEFLRAYVDQAVFQMDADGDEIRVSDGTLEGTDLLVEYGVQTASGAQWFAAGTNGTGFISSTNRLYTTDGTPGNTTELLVCSPTRLVPFGAGIAFSGVDGDGRELWTSDGTLGNTGPVADIHTSGDSDPQQLTVAGGLVFFTAADGDEPDTRELWVSDGTADNTDELEIFAGGDSRIQQLVSVGNRVFFLADDGTNGLELWVSDGTPDGTSMVDDLSDGDSSIPAMAAHDGRLVFSFDDGEHGYELWVSDGTPEGTEMAVDVLPGLEGSAPDSMVSVDGVLVFTATHREAGRELWRSDLTPEGTWLAADTFAGAIGGNPHNPLVSGSRAVFVAGRPGGSDLVWWPTAPVIEEESAFVDYIEDTAPVALAPTATATDAPGASHYTGGHLAVSVTDATSDDQLSLLTDATVTVDGIDISVNGVVVGELSGDGSDGANLVIDFTTTDATAAVVQVLLQRLAYASSSGQPVGVRTVIATAAAGPVSDAVAATVTLLPVNDPPVISAGDIDLAADADREQSIDNWAALDSGDPAESAQGVLEYAVADVSDPDLFAVLPAVDTDGTLTFELAADAVGSSTFTVAGRDDGGTANGGIDWSDPLTITIRIDVPDDAPDGRGDDNGGAPFAGAGLLLLLVAGLAIRSRRA